MRSKLLLVGLLAVVLVGAACDKLGSPTLPSDFPIITTFAADSAIITSGTAAVLRWDVGDPSADVRIDPFVGNVPVVGSTSIVLTATTTFTLNARARSGASAQRVLTVTVKP